MHQHQPHDQLLFLRDPFYLSTTLQLECGMDNLLNNLFYYIVYNIVYHSTYSSIYLLQNRQSIYATEH